MALILGLAWAAVDSQHERPRAEPTSQGSQDNGGPESLGHPTAWQPITWFTLFLVIVGFGQAALFFWQLGYLKSADETARSAADASTVAANAAKSAADVAADQRGILAEQTTIASRQVKLAELQVDAVERLERPLVLPMPPIGLIGYRDSQDKSKFPSLDIGFKNHGRSPAIVEMARLIVIISREPPVKVESGQFSYSESIGDKKMRVYYVDHHWIDFAIGPGEWLSRTEIRHVGDLRADQMDELGTGAQRLWLDGFVRYQDVFGKQRQTHLRWVYDYPLDLMVLDGGNDFNRYT